jgi:hypothetical protein
VANNSNNEILNRTTKKAQKTTPVGPDIKNKTFAGEASWQNILAVNMRTRTAKKMLQSQVEYAIFRKPQHLASLNFTAKTVINQ